MPAHPSWPSSKEIASPPFSRRSASSFISPNDFETQSVAAVKGGQKLLSKDGSPSLEEKNRRSGAGGGGYGGDEGSQAVVSSNEKNSPGMHTRRLSAEPTEVFFSSHHKGEEESSFSSHASGRKGPFISPAFSFAKTGERGGTDLFNAGDFIQRLRQSRPSLPSGSDMTPPALNLDVLTIKQLYLTLFFILLFLIYVAIPFAYFYSKQLESLKGIGYDNQTSVEFDETIPPFTVACAAAQRTIFFTIVLVLVLALILTQRPSFRQPMGLTGGTGGVLAGRGGEQGEEGVLGEGLKHVDFILQYTSELFDLNHRGADSMLYLFCLLIAVGQIGWIITGAYSLAALPVSWLRGRMTPQQQRREIQKEIAELREQQRQLQEEEELQRQSFLFSFLYRIFLPFRWIFGSVLFVLSLSAMSSLAVALIQRYQYSRCTYTCGFVLDDDAFLSQETSPLINPLDEILVRLSRFFPADLFLIGVYVALLFFSLLYGLLSLPRLRVFNKTFWNRICPRRTSPEILLILCFFLVHMLLAASLALLTMAPRYASFGSQTFSPQNGSDELPCSLQVAAGSTTIGGEGGTGETYRHKENACQMSFFAAVFSRAAIAYPSFSNFFFFSDWVFLGVYVLCLIHCVLIRTKQPYISTDRWLEEEEQGNHFFEEMREGGGDGGFRGRCQGLHKSTGSKPSNGRFLGMSGRGKGGGVDDDDDENLRLLASDLRRADV